MRGSRDRIPQPILVTGSHRSGTTWVGGMLALAPGVEIVHEPFNPGTGPGVMRASVPRSFEYVCAENEDRYGDALSDMLAFRYGHLRQLATVRSRADLAGSLADARRFARARRAGARPLVKDALAVFSAEWFAQRFGAQVVVLVRHPAAFASSLLRLGWELDAAWLLQSPQLVRDHVGPYVDDIRRLAERPAGLLEHAALFWRVLYAMVLELRERHPEWIVRRYEDVAADPQREFRDLYERLGLDYTAGVAEQVELHSAAGNPVAWTVVHEVRLDSRAVARGWRRRLSAEQVELVRAVTADVWPSFYDDADWALDAPAGDLSLAS